MTPTKTAIMHHAIGVAGEAGEILDAVKKLLIYDKPLDLDNLIEELGDIEYYLEGLRQAIKVDRETVLLCNIRKLGTRYPNFNYTDAAAIARADKQ